MTNLLRRAHRVCTAAADLKQMRRADKKAAARTRADAHARARLSAPARFARRLVLTSVSRHERVARAVRDPCAAHGGGDRQMFWDPGPRLDVTKLVSASGKPWFPVPPLLLSSTAAEVVLNPKKPADILGVRQMTAYARMATCDSRAVVLAW